MSRRRKPEASLLERQFAALAHAARATLPTNRHSRIMISWGVSAVALEAIAKLPGAKTRACIYRSGDLAERLGGPCAIDSAEATVDGVVFTAQGDSRPLRNGDELAELDAGPAQLLLGDGGRS